MGIRRRKATDIEKILAKILKELGFSFQKEKKIGTYRVDFYVKELNLSVQADGCWHHGLSCCNEELSFRQKVQHKRDLACISYHKHCGLNIVRLPGCKIKEKPLEVKEVLIKYMKEIVRGNKIYIAGEDYE
jgi:very-short-patch-repair endonuclease